jgi:hypothetical protein
VHAWGTLPEGMHHQRFAADEGERLRCHGRGTSGPAHLAGTGPPSRSPPTPERSPGNRRDPIRAGMMTAAAARPAAEQTRTAAIPAAIF